MKGSVSLKRTEKGWRLDVLSETIKRTPLGPEATDSPVVSLDLDALDMGYLMAGHSVTADLTLPEKVTA